MSANKAANARRQLDETRKRTDSDMNPAWSRAASVVTIDKSVIPLTGTLPALTQQGKPRPVTAFANEHPGANCDFVVGELILHENDNGTSLTRLLEQLGGRLLASSPGSSVHGVDGLGQYHLIGVDVAATGTDPELIGQWLAELDPEARAALRFQNPLAVETFAVTAKAAAAGFLVGLNVLWYGHLEGPVGPALDDGTPWDPDPHNWPHMRRGGAQDIGVVSAWHRLWEANRMATPVQVTVVDGGFSREPDTPFAQTIPPDAYGRPSRWPNSGGAPAPWHGTGVAGSIASFATDGQGSAGSAAPLARLRMSLLETPAPEFFAIANALLQHVPQALSWGPRSQT